MHAVDNADALLLPWMRDIVTSNVPALPILDTPPCITRASHSSESSPAPLTNRDKGARERERARESERGGRGKRDLPNLPVFLRANHAFDENTANAPLSATGRNEFSSIGGGEDGGQWKGRWEKERQGERECVWWEKGDREGKIESEREREKERERKRESERERERERESERDMERGRERKRMFNVPALPF